MEKKLLEGGAKGMGKLVVAGPGNGAGTSSAFPLIFCFVLKQTSHRRAGIENKMFICDLVFSFSGKNVKRMQAVF